MSRILHPWGAGKLGDLLKWCPVTVLNTDILSCSHLAISGSCVGQEPQK